MGHEARANEGERRRGRGWNTAVAQIATCLVVCIHTSYIHASFVTAAAAQPFGMYVVCILRRMDPTKLSRNKQQQTTEIMPRSSLQVSPRAPKQQARNTLTAARSLLCSHSGSRSVRRPRSPGPVWRRAARPAARAPVAASTRENRHIHSGPGLNKTLLETARSGWDPITAVLDLWRL